MSNEEPTKEKERDSYRAVATAWEAWLSKRPAATVDELPSQDPDVVRAIIEGWATTDPGGSVPDQNHVGQLVVTRELYDLLKQEAKAKELRLLLLEKENVTHRARLAWEAQHRCVVAARVRLRARTSGSAAAALVTALEAAQDDPRAR